MSTPAPQPLYIDDLSTPQLAPELRHLMADMVAAAPHATYTEQAVLEAASAQTGLDDFGANSFRVHLRAALEAMDADSDQSDFGRLSNFNCIVRNVANRLRLEQLISQHPEIEQLSIRRPIIIAGLPRSGTTHMHNLLGADPNSRCLPYWESIEPVPPPEDLAMAANGEDPRITRCRETLAMQDAVLPYFRNMHEMTPEHAHEEIELAMMDCSSMLFETYGMVPTWRDYYLAQDQRPSYCYMARALKALQWLRGPANWVLKSQQHIEQLPTLAETFPDATFVLPHRDPVAIVVSLSTMLSYTFRLSRDPVRPKEVAAYWHDRLLRMLQAGIRDHDQLPTERRVDVAFDDFMADPMAVIANIYQVAGRDLSGTTLATLQCYQASHRRNRFGRIHYDIDALGLDIPQLRRDFRFYTERFGLREEY